MFINYEELAKGTLVGKGLKTVSLRSFGLRRLVFSILPPALLSVTGAGVERVCVLWKC